jgi:hypothetical protein
MLAGSGRYGWVRRAPGAGSKATGTSSLLLDPGAEATVAGSRALGTLAESPGNHRATPGVGSGPVEKGSPALGSTPARRETLRGCADLNSESTGSRTRASDSGSEERGTGSPGCGNSGRQLPGSGDAVPEVGKGVPRVGHGVPRSGQLVPHLGEPMPHSGEPVPRLGGLPPRLGDAVPRSGHPAPRMGHQVPLPQPSNSSPIRNDQPGRRSGSSSTSSAPRIRISSRLR